MLSRATLALGLTIMQSLSLYADEVIISAWLALDEVFEWM